MQTFYNPTRVIMGCGAQERASEYLNGRSTLIVTTPGSIVRGAVSVLAESASLGTAHQVTAVHSTYSLDDIDALTQSLNPGQYDSILAIGGGTAIDVAKCLSVLLHDNADGFSLDGHFRHGIPMPHFTPIPVIAIPTTAGSGSEVTPFATVWDRRGKSKFSLVSDRLFPVTAIVDPILTFSQPTRLAISSGLDAISHAFESIWNKNASPVTVSLATRSLQLSLRSLGKFVDDPEDLDSRKKLSEASLLAGLAISNTRTALAHSMSYPISVRLGVEHGVAAAFTLPSILEFNAEADDGRLAELARALNVMNCDQLAELVRELLTGFDSKGLFPDRGLSAEQLSSLVPEMYTPARADNNLRTATMEDVGRILVDSWATLDRSIGQNR
jgi:phosphonate metabolism-associated iron-containing alcohol dehydrogenase